MRVVAAIAAAFLLTGCPGNQRGEDISQSGPSQSSTSTTNPQAVPEKSTAMNPVVPRSKEFPAQRVPAARASIPVQLTEYAIQMPDTIAAGPQTFHISDGGDLKHSFAIEGNGVAQQLTNPLTRGDTADMIVNLKPGTYAVYCPVDGHRQRGMQRTLTVR